MASESVSGTRISTGPISIFKQGNPNPNPQRCRQLSAMVGNGRRLSRKGAPQDSRRGGSNEYIYFYHRSWPVCGVVASALVAAELMRGAGAVLIGWDKRG